jgi:hypothetical protein
MSTVLRLIAEVVWSDQDSIVPVLLIIALLGVLASLWAALNGIEMVDF